jgi:hypothetical protein
VGDAEGGVETVSRLCALLIALVCRMIGPDTCEAVLGDLAEAGASNAATLAGLLGFLVRSQMQAWRMPRPRLVLVGIGVPLGLLLNSVAIRVSAGQSVYVWMYAHNWTNTYLHAGWLWSEMVPMLSGMILSWLRVALLSGVSGYVLVMLAQRTAWLHGIVLILLLINGRSVGIAFMPAAIFPMLSDGAMQTNAAAFVSSFYRVVLPLNEQILFAFIPMLHGMYRAQRTLRRKQLRSA